MMFSVTLHLLEFVLINCSSLPSRKLLPILSYCTVPLHCHSMPASMSTKMRSTLKKRVAEESSQYLFNNWLWIVCLTDRLEGKEAWRPTQSHNTRLFFIFQTKLANATLGLKKMGNLLWKVGKKFCPVGCLILVLLNWDSQQGRPFPYLPKGIFSFLSNMR